MTRKRRGPKLELRRLEKLLKDFSRVRLMVVGDVVLDEYLRGDVERVSPEAPVPIVRVHGESVVLGGAGHTGQQAKDHKGPDENISGVLAALI